MAVQLGIVKQALKTTGAAFRSKGALRKWNTKNTVSGLLATVTAQQAVADGITWPTVCMGLVAVLPICFSFLQRPA